MLRYSHYHKKRKKKSKKVSEENFGDEQIDDQQDFVVRKYVSSSDDESNVETAFTKTRSGRNAQSWKACFFKWQFNTKTLLPFFCFATDFSLIWAKHSISSLYFGTINIYLWKVEQFSKFRFVSFILSTQLDLGNAQVTLQYTQFVCKSVWD